jgi:hypothetical protein
MSQIKQRLVLARWMVHQFGFVDYEVGFTTLNEALKKCDSGWDEQNVSHFRRALETVLAENVDCRISLDELIGYDLNIITHWQAITRLRNRRENREIYPLPFQYLILLFSEFYLDYWTRAQRDESNELLNRLNNYRLEFNERFADLSAPDRRKMEIPKFQPDDLHKLAIWAATGSGKTLVMHCQHLQLQHYLSNRKLARQFNKTFLITPNEGLSAQHLEDLHLSGIPARRFSKDNQGTLPGFDGRELVEVIEITKLKEKSGITTVDVAELGTNNIVLIDEGHRGLAGEVEFKNRQALCAEGFSLEFSATFGQSINSLTGPKIQEMGDLYAQSILFDYSYKRFYHDGYGKEFEILNYDRKPGAHAAEIQHSYLIACLARFFQQCKLYEDKGQVFAPYLLENPLMILVGGSVTGKKKYDEDGNSEGNREATDVIQAIRFFARFCSQENEVVDTLDKLLRNQLNFGDGGAGFARAFHYLQQQYPVTEDGAAARLYADILQLCFHSAHAAPLYADYFTGSISEIGLRVGQSPDYFGVIKVGEGKKLWDLIAADSEGEEGQRSLVASEREFGVSLFDGIKDKQSKTRVLIGAKMFTEGWSCWRVSAMGLINVGRNEGSQIIQLFGRGVRLKGKGFGLKRSNALREDQHPDQLIELETLNVFGIRADYMDTFRKYIDEEGVVKESDKVEIALPTIENLARTDLKVILPKKDKPEFKETTVLPLEKKRLRGVVTADWYGRLSSLHSRYRLTASDDSIQPQPQILKPENLKFLDYDEIYFAALRYKRKNALYNLEIDRDQVRVLLVQSDWYQLYLPPGILEFRSFADVALWQEIATDLVLKYIRKFYDYHRDEHDAPFQEYRAIKKILDDPGETYNAQFLRNLRIEYLATMDKSRDQLITDLGVIRDDLVSEKLAEYNGHNVELFKFANHLYHPLIHVADGELKVSIKPAALNKHEKQFCYDLKAWVEREENGFLADKELYLLRNQSRGKGISFFAEGGFFPDFILWIMEEDKQHIYFLDPHGLRHARAFQDAKIQFHKTIKEIEKERLNDPQVTLDSWIISPTRRSAIEHWSAGKDPQDFLNHHVVFMYDEPEGYIDQILQGGSVVESPEQGTLM